MQLVVDKFGRMILPKAVRQRFGLHAGDVMDATEQGDTIVLRLASRQDCINQEDGVLVFVGKATGSIERAVEEHRNGRLEQSSAWKARP